MLHLNSTKFVFPVSELIGSKQMDILCRQLYYNNTWFWNYTLEQLPKSAVYLLRFIYRQCLIFNFEAHMTCLKEDQRLPAMLVTPQLP